MKKRKASGAAQEPTPSRARRGLPTPVRDLPVSPDERSWIYTDGSYTSSHDDFVPDLCGWGFSILPSSGGTSIDMCGPVDLTLEGPLSDLQAAQHKSNNVGELCAMLHCLCWLTHNRLAPRVTIAYDSTYACNTITGVWHPRANLSLVLRCRQVYSIVRTIMEVDWHKVESHTGDFHNERADQLADCGARGIRHYSPEVASFVQVPIGGAALA